MNRVQKRAYEKKQPKFIIKDVQKAFHIALEMKKHTKGHLFSENLKGRCVFCGVTQKTRKQCDYWFLTFMDRVQSVLINPSFYTDDEIQALWLQHGEEYQNIQLPLNIGAKPKSQSSTSEKVEHE